MDFKVRKPIKKRFVSQNETVGVEYGMTIQDPKGTYIKVRASRNTVIQANETVEGAYSRAWDDAIKQVESIMENI